MSAIGWHDNSTDKVAKVNWGNVKVAMGTFETTQAMEALRKDGRATVLYEALTALLNSARAQDAAAYYVALAKCEAAMSLYESERGLAHDAALFRVPA